jgi:hypothetical protein
MQTTISNLTIPSAGSLLGALRSYGHCLDPKWFPGTSTRLARTLNEIEDLVRKANRELKPCITVTIPYSADEIRFVLDEAYEDMRQTCENLRVFIPKEKAIANREARNSIESEFNEVNNGR